MTNRSKAAWGAYPVEDLRRSKTLNVGPLKLWLSSTRREVRFAFRLGEAATAASQAREPAREPESWTRWANEDREALLHLAPVLSDLPLVVRPKDPLFVGREMKVRIYVRIPVWCRLSLTSHDSERIAREFPTLVLSKSWAGSPTEGELCYWAPTSARREVGADAFEPHLAICPVEISNDSSEELHLERLCLRVAHSSIFATGSQLWVDQTEISYTGGGKISRVHVTGQPPAEAAGARLLTGPRSPEKRSFSAWSFSWLKDLPGFGAIV